LPRALKETDLKKDARYSKEQEDCSKALKIGARLGGQLDIHPVGLGKTAAVLAIPKASRESYWSRRSKETCATARYLNFWLVFCRGSLGRRLVCYPRSIYSDWFSGTYE
ncbi:hypothetical protein RYX36_023907, partial [Vicia faba]